jgi:signal transducing adaptor molecule
MALAMSIKESKGATPTAAKSNAPRDTAAPSQPAQPVQPVPSGTTAATVSRVRALFDFQPSEPGELQFRKGDVIAVLESVYKDWWKGSLRGNTGIFPLNYVEKLQDPTTEELEREAHMEAEVFAQIRNVEKLLALLSTSSQGGGDSRDNEEITELYHSTLAIRPKLIELIGKYSQKKGRSKLGFYVRPMLTALDDFTQLNEKFIKARRDYESLLEASMSQPQQPYGGRPYPPYNAPPSGAYGGYPPSSPPPQQAGYNYAGPPPAASQPPPSQYPPTASNPAFFMVPPGQQRPPQQAPTPSQSADPYIQPQRTTAQRPLSYAPQELATGHYDSPIDNRHSFVGPPPSQTPSAPQGYDYPPSQAQQPPPNAQAPGGYPPQSSAPPSAPPPGPQNPYEQGPPVAYQAQSPPDSYAQPPPQQGGYGGGYPPQQPNHAPPAPPGASSSPPPQAAQGYLPYRPGGQAPAPSAPVGGAGGDEGYYR